MKAVQFCHDRQYCHRDLKPENILMNFDPNTHICSDLKLCDFGLSIPFQKYEISMSELQMPFHGMERWLKAQSNGAHECWHPAFVRVSDVANGTREPGDAEVVAAGSADGGGGNACSGCRVQDGFW